MNNLTKLPNIGSELAKRLGLAGINSSEKLFALGTEKVFIKLKTIYPDACHINYMPLKVLFKELDGMEFQKKKRRVKRVYENVEN